jgi:DNA-binding NarL/FixJ family response regulator
VIRVLLADDHEIVRDGLKRILAASSDVQVAGEAANGDEALALVRANDYDLALLDMSMPGLSGIDLVKRLKVEKPKMKLLVLSMHGEPQYAARALKAGASGYLTKDSAAEKLVGAIRKVAAGGLLVSEAAAAGLLAASTGEGPLHSRLSDREFEVFTARQRREPHRDRAPPAPVGENRKHPQDAHPGKARPGEHCRAGALRPRAPAPVGPRPRRYRSFPTRGASLRTRRFSFRRYRRA